LYDHQFSSLRQICKYDGTKNYHTTANYVDYLVKHGIVCKIPFWHSTAYYVDVDDKVVQAIAKYHTTKHKVALKINKVAKENSNFQEKLAEQKIIDLTKIAKTNIPTKSLDTENLDYNCITIIDFLNLIFLATRILILEEKKNSDIEHLAKRHARIGEMWLRLEEYFDRWSGKLAQENEFMSTVKSREAKMELDWYRKYFSHLTHSKTTFSEYAQIIRQILFGYKQEQSLQNEMSMPLLNKVIQKFTDKSGRINTRYLGEMKRIETASVPKFHDDDIDDFWILESIRDDLNRTRWRDDEKTLEERGHTIRLIKMAYPKMKIN
jgi:hypothetical protein